MDLLIDDTLEKEDSACENSKSSEVKEDSEPGDSRGTDSCDRITVAGNQGLVVQMMDPYSVYIQSFSLKLSH